MLKKLASKGLITKNAKIVKLNPKLVELSMTSPLLSANILEWNFSSVSPLASSPQVMLQQPKCRIEERAKKLSGLKLSGKKSTLSNSNSREWRLL